MKFAAGTAIITLAVALSCTMNGPSFNTLVWSDEFNGDSIESENWSYEIGTGKGGGWSRCRLGQR